MRRYRLTVAYDGTRFVGWQWQPHGISIQQLLEEAAQPLVAPAVCRMYGSGRTDAGVHARGQVVHFDMAREMAPVQLRRALNGQLPPEIQVLEAAETRADFDARRQALGREYRYFIWNGEVIPPERRLYAAHVRRPLDPARVREAAARFVGRHDFAAFSANPHREQASTEREVFGVEVEAEGPEIAIHVRGEGFLYKMVRSMAGFLIAVGTGRETPESVTEVMASRLRTSRVETAPPQGLFLWHVWYE